jgi:flagellar hook-associated protein 3 FlgL
MKTSFISSLAAQNSMRMTIQRSQVEIQKLQTEVVTGRYADIGEALGASVSRSVTLNREVLRLDTIKDSNSLVTQRLSASQLALGEMSTQAQDLLEAFISVNSSNDANRLSVADQEIRNALSAFTSAANTSSNGEFLLGGVNTDTKPLTDYQAAGNPAKATFDTAFLTHFGFAQTDPAAAGITVADMDDFLTNTLEPLFTGPQWNTDWSTASDSNVTSRISRTELVESSANANEEGIRKFALAAVMGLELLSAPISDEVRALVNSRAIQHAGEGVNKIDNIRSKLGISENRVNKANIALEAQIQIFELHVADLEEVDAYEASTRMKALLAQVETSYQLTARLQQLSLTNFL